MTETLNLSNNNEVFIFAFLYGFRGDDGKGEYFGGLTYLMKRCNVSESTASRSIANLEKRKLITRRSLGTGKPNAYSINNKTLEKILKTTAPIFSNTTTDTDTPEQPKTTNEESETKANTKQNESGHETKINICPKTEWTELNKRFNKKVYH